MSKEPTSVEGVVQCGNVTIGTTPTRLTSTGQKFIRGVTLRTPTGNSGVVYVGGATNVASTNGYILLINETLFLAVEDLSQICIVASASAQNLVWIGI